MSEKPKTTGSGYRRHFSLPRLWRSMRRLAERAGQQGVYTVLLLYYAYRRKDTPFWAKNIVLGALGYLIAPIDALPDLTPILGYTDDIGVLGFALVTISAYVNEEVKEKARGRMGKWFKKVDEEDIRAVDEKL